MSFQIVPDDATNKSRAFTSVDGYFTDSAYEPPKVPILYDAIRNNTQQALSNVIPVDYNSIVEMTVYNDDPMEHVFHLHGHVFQVVGHGTQLNLVPQPSGNKPMYPERDTIAVPGCKIRKPGGAPGGPADEGLCGGSKGYVRIRFVANNPGAWLFHCHIEWHMMQGLVITFVSGADKLAKTRVPPRIIDGCARSGVKLPAARYWSSLPSSA
nr:ferroxidase fet3 [Polyrhizophydium stewartii]